MRVLGVIFFAVLVLVGCGTDKQTMQLIGEAESVMIEYPDSALNIMRSIDPATIRGDEDMAHYRLAMAEAMYHHYVDDGRDSLTTLFYDYYLKSDDHEKRARALYQHAFAMRSVGKVPDAVCALHEAEKSLVHTKNYRLAGLVHSIKGTLYSSQCLYQDALESYKLAELYFQQSNLSSHIAYALYDIGTMYSEMKFFTQAIEFLNNSYVMACELNDSYLAYLSRIDMCYIYIQNLEYSKAESILTTIDYNEISDIVTTDFYCVNAILSAQKGDFILASEYLDSIVDAPILASTMRIDYAYYCLSLFQEDYKQALEIYKGMISSQNQNVYHMITDSPLHYDVQLLEKDIDHEKEISQKNRIINTLVYILIFVVFASLFYYVYSRNKSNRLRIATLMVQIENVQNELYSKGEKIKVLHATAEEKRSAVAKMQHQLNTNICRGLQNINSLLDAYYIDNTKSLKQREIIAAIDSYVANFAESPEGYYAVEQFVNQYRDNIMELLRIELPMFKESDYRLLCLVYADFSSNAICMFMNCDKNKLYKQKSKLKSIISQSNSEHKQVFLKYL